MIGEIRDAIHILDWLFSSRSSELEAQSLDQFDEFETGANALALRRRIQLTNTGKLDGVVADVNIYSELYTIPDEEKIEGSNNYIKNRNVYRQRFEREQVVSSDKTEIHKPAMTLVDLSELPARFNMKIEYEYTVSDPIETYLVTAEEWIQIENNRVK